MVDPETGVLYARQSWPAEYAELAAIRTQVRHWLGSAILDEDLLAGLLAAVDEVVGNAVEHAHRSPGSASDSLTGATVELTVAIDRMSVDIEIADHGRWRPPGAVRHGRGLVVVGELVDSVRIHLYPSGTRVLLHQSIPAPSSRSVLSPAATGRPHGRRVLSHTTDLRL